MPDPVSVQFDFAFEEFDTVVHIQPATAVEGTADGGANIGATRSGGNDDELRQCHELPTDIVAGTESLSNHFSRLRIVTERVEDGATEAEADPEGTRRAARAVIFANHIAATADYPEATGPGIAETMTDVAMAQAALELQHQQRQQAAKEQGRQQKDAPADILSCTG